MTDDEIIRNRLLVDGEGMGDDRRLNIILKSFIKWCTADETVEDSNLTYERLLAMIAQCEFYMQKSHMASTMYQTEMEYYDSHYKQIEKDIAEAQKKIADCKIALRKAKIIRKNRQEYDALAKVIQLHPARQQTMKELEELDKTLTSLQARKRNLQQKLEMRRKQFHVMMTSIHELQKLLDVDENLDEAKDDKMETT